PRRHAEHRCLRLMPIRVYEAGGPRTALGRARRMTCRETPPALQRPLLNEELELLPRRSGAGDPELAFANRLALARCAWTRRLRSGLVVAAIVAGRGAVLALGGIAVLDAAVIVATLR